MIEKLTKIEMSVKNEYKIFDVSCPFDGRAIEREEEKKEMYEDLRREVAKP